MKYGGKGNADIPTTSRNIEDPSIMTILYLMTQLLPCGFTLLSCFYLMDLPCCTLYLMFYLMVYLIACVYLVLYLMVYLVASI